MTYIPSACPKNRYRTQEIALAVAEKCVQERGVPLRAYYCGACDGWHLTRANATPTRAKPAETVESLTAEKKVLKFRRREALKIVESDTAHEMEKTVARAEITRINRRAQEIGERLRALKDSEPNTKVRTR